MSGKKSSMHFFILYRRRVGADVDLGEVACLPMKEVANGMVTAH